MSYIAQQTITVTTDGSGDATAFTGVVNGYIEQIRYVKDDYASGVDFVITTETSGVTIWSQINVNASVTVAPRQPTHSTVGVASLYDTVSSEPVETRIAVSDERIQIVIDEGGAATDGTFYITIG